MFEAMAEVATEVVTVNGLSDQVAVVAAKSSDIDSLPFQPDILVSELLDSALLGEGIV
jgi:predicted RNA methylase